MEIKLRYNFFLYGGGGVWEEIIFYQVISTKRANFSLYNPLT